MVISEGELVDIGIMLQQTYMLSFRLPELRTWAWLNLVHNFLLLDIKKMPFCLAVDIYIDL